MTEVAGIPVSTTFTITGAVAGAYVAIQAVSAKIDSLQSQENRRFVAGWLRGLSVSTTGWDRFFGSLFALVYGDRHFSLKCFLRSSLQTLFLVLFANVFLTVVNPERWTSLLQGGLPRWVGLTMVSVFCFVIIDYVILFKTRYLLAKSNQLITKIGLAGSVALDFTLTVITASLILALIAPIAIAMITVVVTISLGMVHRLLNWGLWANIYTYVFSFPPEMSQNLDTAYGDHKVVELTTLALYPFLTSAWIWAYMLVASAVRLLSYFPLMVRGLAKVVDVDDHPVSTLGFFVALISALLVGIGAILLKVI